VPIGFISQELFKKCSKFGNIFQGPIHLNIFWQSGIFQHFKQNVEHFSTNPKGGFS